MKKKVKVISLTKHDLNTYSEWNPEYAKKIKKGEIKVQFKLDLK